MKRKRKSKNVTISGEFVEKIQNIADKYKISFSTALHLILVDFFSEKKDKEKVLENLVDGR